MSTINISLPDVVKEFVDQQVSTAGYGESLGYHQVRGCMATVIFPIGC